MNIALLLFVPMLLLAGGLVLWSILTETTVALPRNAPRTPRHHKKARGRSRKHLQADGSGNAAELVSLNGYGGTGLPPALGVDDARDPLRLVVM